MRRLVSLLLLTLAALPAPGANPEPVQLTVKPQLCVLDRGATACPMTLEIHWKSLLEAVYCLNESTQPDPLHCWTRALAGDFTHQRLVGEDFIFWLTSSGSPEHLSEVKISVLRVDSADRRRNRRTRHVWEVL